jgi:hypothetical protein
MGLKQMQNAVSPSGVGLPLYVGNGTSEMGCSGDQELNASQSLGKVLLPRCANSACAVETPMVSDSRIYTGRF